MDIRKPTKLVFQNLVLALLIVVPATGYSYQSAPGCPKETGSKVWLQDEAGNCHEVNSRGPCGENMLFFPHPIRAEKVLGFCDCFDARKETELEVKFLNNRNLTGCLKDMRSQIFVPERNRCFSAFDQGPCPDGKWLVLNTTFYPVCAENHCSSSSGTFSPGDDASSTQFIFSHSTSDKCYMTQTRGYCPKSYKLHFTPNHWTPKCRFSPPKQKKMNCSFNVSEIFRLQCKPGSRRDFLSKCSQSINPRK